MDSKFPKCHMEICWLENLSRTISAARSASESASKRVVNEYLVGS
jgi:hypothetical protein